MKQDDAMKTTVYHINNFLWKQRSREKRIWTWNNWISVGWSTQSFKCGETRKKPNSVLRGVIAVRAIIGCCRQPRYRSPAAHPVKKNPFTHDWLFHQKPIKQNQRSKQEKKQTWRKQRKRTTQMTEWKGKYANSDNKNTDKTIS